MTQIVLGFEGPYAELTLSPTTDQIRTVLEMGDAHWTASAGLLGWVILREVGYSNDWSLPSLALILVEAHGVHVRFRHGGNGCPSQLIDSGGVGDETCTVSTGGEDFKLPLRSFLPLDLACVVIEWFLEFQTPAPAHIWRPCRESRQPGLEYADIDPPT